MLSAVIDALMKKLIFIMFVHLLISKKSSLQHNHFKKSTIRFILKQNLN